MEPRGTGEDSKESGERIPAKPFQLGSCKDTLPFTQRWGITGGF